ncbi:MAG: DUF6682 family protein [Solimonas sp.]
MTLIALIAELRGRLGDRALPYLCSDDELTLWLNEAEREACERSRLLYDETSSLARLNVLPSKSIYKLDPRILQVDTVRLASSGRNLDRTTKDKLDACAGNWRADEGRVEYFYEEPSYLGFYRSPAVADTAYLALWRLPLEDMRLNDPQACPEVASRYHMRLLDWPIFRAYSKQDSDLYDAEKAATAEAAFTISFGIRPDSNVQRKQRSKKVPICRAEW